MILESLTRPQITKSVRSATVAMALFCACSVRPSMSTSEPSSHPAQHIINPPMPRLRYMGGALRTDPHLQPMDVLAQVCALNTDVHQLQIPPRAPQTVMRWVTVLSCDSIVGICMSQFVTMCELLSPLFNSVFLRNNVHSDPFYESPVESISATGARPAMTEAPSMPASEGEPVVKIEDDVMDNISVPSAEPNRHARTSARPHPYHARHTRQPRAAPASAPPTTRQPPTRVHKAHARRVLLCCDVCHYRRVPDISPSTVTWYQEAGAAEALSGEKEL